MRFTLFSALLATGLLSPAPNAFCADETCAACDRQIHVSGPFGHSTSDGAPILGARGRADEAFREEIYGTQFAISIPNLDPGKYTVTLGEVETHFEAAAQRRFERPMRQPVPGDKLRHFSTAAGGANKVCFLSAEVEMRTTPRRAH